MKDWNSFNQSNHYKDYVVVNGTHYYVSTVSTFDAGWETMVFPCDEDNRIISWADLYCRHYPNESSAKEGHKHTIENLEKYI